MYIYITAIVGNKMQLQASEHSESRWRMNPVRQRWWNLGGQDHRTDLNRSVFLCWQGGGWNPWRSMSCGQRVVNLWLIWRQNSELKLEKHGGWWEFLWMMMIILWTSNLLQWVFSWVDDMVMMVMMVMMVIVSSGYWTRGTNYQDCCSSDGASKLEIRTENELHKQNWIQAERWILFEWFREFRVCFCVLREHQFSIGFYPHISYLFLQIDRMFGKRASSQLFLEGHWLVVSC